MKTTSLMLISVLAVAACTSYVGSRSSAVLGTSPALGGGEFSSGGGVTIAADIREKDGRTLLCGAWVQSREQSVLTKGRARDVLTRGSVALDGTQIAREISFMREVAPTADFSGAAAHCRLIDRAWQSGDDARELSVHVARHVVYRESDGVGGGVIVLFRPGKPGAGGI